MVRPPDDLWLSGGLSRGLVFFLREIQGRMLLVEKTNEAAARSAESSATVRGEASAAMESGAVGLQSKNTSALPAQSGEQRRTTGVGGCRLPLRRTAQRVMPAVGRTDSAAGEGSAAAAFPAKRQMASADGGFGSVGVQEENCAGFAMRTQARRNRSAKQLLRSRARAQAHQQRLRRSGRSAAGGGPARGCVQPLRVRLYAHSSEVRAGSSYAAVVKGAKHSAAVGV